MIGSVKRNAIYIPTRGRMELPTIRALLGFLKPYPWALPIVILLGLAATFAEGIGIGLIIPLLDMLLLKSGNSSTASIPLLKSFSPFFRGNSNLHNLLLVGAGILTLITTKAILIYFSAYVSTRINGRVDDNIRRALFRQILTVEYGFLMRSDYGRIVNIFETQSWRATEAMITFFDLVGDICTILVFVFLLLLLSWQLTLVVTALALAVSLLVSRPMVQHVHRLGDATVSASSAISQRVLTTLNGMRVVRAFGQEAFEQDNFEKVSDNARKLYVRMNHTTRIIPSLLEIAYVPIILSAVLIAQYLNIGVPILLAFLLLFYRLQPQIRAIDQRRALVASYAGAVLEISTLVAAKNEPAAASGTLQIEGLKDGIVFRQVGFDYQAGDGSRRALSNISLEFRARQTTAIVGMSGAGKSTIINLIYRFYEPTEGEILVDGTPLADLDVVAWRARLALSGQDAALIDGSIFQNIAYGCRSANVDSVIEVARLAAIHDFIEALPRGYQTEVGEGGRRLSDGQRQRLALARALLRQPDILILDEATNAIDGLTEQLVGKALDLLTHQKTAIVIAHRLSTIRRADHVIVLDNGRLVEQGSPEDLLARGSYFSRLYKAQFVDHSQSDANDS